jgi:methionyl-tRNA formyltransferase
MDDRSSRHGQSQPARLAAAQVPRRGADSMGHRIRGDGHGCHDDTGDILLQKEVSIAPEDTAVTLSPHLAEVGAKLMIQTLEGLRSGAIQARPQDDAAASLAPILKREDGLIDFRRSAVEICNRLRGFQPWPGAYTRLRGKGLQVWSAQSSARSAPLAAMNLEGDRLFAGCGDETSLELIEVQLEGKKRMAARDFIHGYRIRTGERLG